MAGAGLLATSIFDNDILDEFTIPFGNWVKQMVDWTDQNLDWLLKIIEWPFNFLLDTFVSDFLAQISWVWICLAVFVIGSLVRNVRIGLITSLALAGCGLLGQQYWLETSRTIGMILVAVLLCAAIGIPLGVACGRFDAVWNAVRPAMDAMQVVHAFVYMLPVVFFWGIGVVPATMVTMVFAIPPLIRLTNLGIRQVPEDVVEASRAYGAPEWRVLTDVQLPLALPAIMTGLNQTLLMAIAMLGIAAIMGAGGLGLLVFRAVNNLNVALAASAGLALFLVAVVLDRISQPEASDGGSLLSRINRAWANRKTPEVLLEESGATVVAPAPSSEGVPAVVEGRERLGLIVAAVGSLIAMVSTFLTWANDTGPASSWSRAVDETELVGQSFSGLAATGGSWFGFIVLAMGLWGLAAAASTLTRPGVGPRWLNTDASLFAAFAVLATAIGYLFIQTTELVTSYSPGVGPYVAIVAGLIAAVGAATALFAAPFTPRRPLADKVSIGPIFTACVALVLIVIGSMSIWTEDRRARQVMTPEVAAEIEALRQESIDNPATAPLNAQRVSNLANSTRNAETDARGGLSDNGPRLGWPMLGIGVLGLLAALPASGVFGKSEQWRWRWSVVMAAIGLAGLMIPIAWVASVLRTADPNFVSGAGSFLAGTGAFLLIAANKGILELFRRRRVFTGDATHDVDVIDVSTETSVERDLMESAAPAGAGR